jgi:hypothetical protein
MNSWLWIALPLRLDVPSPLGLQTRVHLVASPRVEPWCSHHDFCEGLDFSKSWQLEMWSLVGSSFSCRRTIRPGKVIGQRMVVGTPFWPVLAKRKRVPLLESRSDGRGRGGGRGRGRGDGHGRGQGRGRRRVPPVVLDAGGVAMVPVPDDFDDGDGAAGGDEGLDVNEPDGEPVAAPERPEPPEPETDDDDEPAGDDMNGDSRDLDDADEVDEDLMNHSIVGDGWYFWPRGGGLAHCPPLPPPDPGPEMIDFWGLAGLGEPF